MTDIYFTPNKAPERSNFTERPEPDWMREVRNTSVTISSSKPGKSSTFNMNETVKQNKQYFEKLLTNSNHNT